ncbi:MAG: hypothetical protein JKY40_10475 [Gammaproteobacteria bacterium]|nr:hypothetical protein [Gammaproteobacteria bacterium]MBL4729710.1 hypothetical protein [Gammaproteobacteria bacterium]
MKTENKSKQGVSKKDEQGYYAESQAWESEIVNSARSRARIFGWIAVISTSCFVLMVITLMLLIPLKETVPYVIEVDTISGLVEVKRPLDEGVLTQSEAVTKFFLVQYINAREGYLFDTAAQDYETVQKMSSQSVANRHYQWFQPSNADSPLNLHGEKGSVEIEVRSVSFVDEDTVTIPIRRTTIGNGTSTDTFEVITISFLYQNNPTTEQDRFINPLGFQVTAYRSDPQLIQE